MKPAGQSRTLESIRIRISPLRRPIVLALLFFAIHPAGIRPQQETGRIRVQTTLVQVPVMVSDARGGPVVGLAADDFALFDDGVRQPLAFFATSSEPIRIALLLDTSKSTAPVLDRIRKAAAGFLEQLRPQDQAMLATFNGKINILCRFGTDVPELKEAIGGVGLGDTDTTRLYDAVKMVADRYLRAVQGRKAVILLTDGQDHGSSGTPDDMIGAALNAGAVVYPIYYSVDLRALVKELFGVSLRRNQGGGRMWEKEKEAAAALLQRTADESAGTMFRSDAKDLKKTFQRVAEELRHQYLLAFYPIASRLDGAPHTIKVDLNRPLTVVRSRRSYRASETSGR